MMVPVKVFGDVFLGGGVVTLFRGVIMARGVAIALTTRRVVGS